MAKYCLELKNSTLVLIHSQGENEVLRKYSHGYSHRIGLYKDKFKGEWLWYDGSPVDYVNWKNPDDANDLEMNHAYMDHWDGKWVKIRWTMTHIF